MSIGDGRNLSTWEMVYALVFRSLTLFQYIQESISNYNGNAVDEAGSKCFILLLLTFAGFAKDEKVFLFARFCFFTIRFCDCRASQKEKKKYKTTQREYTTQLFLFLSLLYICIFPLTVVFAVVDFYGWVSFFVRFALLPICNNFCSLFVDLFFLCWREIRVEMFSYQINWYAVVSNISIYKYKLMNLLNATWFLFHLQYQWFSYFSWCFRCRFETHRFECVIPLVHKRRKSGLA